MYIAYFVVCILFVFFFKQKTAYEMRISDWSSDVCSSDLVIFDEFQDANPVTAQLVKMQHELYGTKLLYLGDEHQSIYAFRGAQDALASLPGGAYHYPLTQAWRFGPRTAQLPNLLLRVHKEERLQLEGMGSDREWHPNTNRKSLVYDKHASSSVVFAGR